MGGSVALFFLLRPAFMADGRHFMQLGEGSLATRVIRASSIALRPAPDSRGIGTLVGSGTLAKACVRVLEITPGIFN